MGSKDVSFHAELLNVILLMLSVLDPREEVGTYEDNGDVEYERETGRAASLGQPAPQPTLSSLPSLEHLQAQRAAATESGDHERIIVAELALRQYFRRRIKEELVSPIQSAEEDESGSATASIDTCSLPEIKYLRQVRDWMRDSGSEVDVELAEKALRDRFEEVTKAEIKARDRELEEETKLVL